MSPDDICSVVPATTIQMSNNNNNNNKPMLRPSLFMQLSASSSSSSSSFTATSSPVHSQEQSPRQKTEKDEEEEEEEEQNHERKQHTNRSINKTNNGKECVLPSSSDTNRVVRTGSNPGIKSGNSSMHMNPSNPTAATIPKDTVPGWAKKKFLC